MLWFYWKITNSIAGEEIQEFGCSATNRKSRDQAIGCEGVQDFSQGPGPTLARHGVTGRMPGKLGPNVNISLKNVKNQEPEKNQNHSERCVSKVGVLGNLQAKIIIKSGM